MAERKPFATRLNEFEAETVEVVAAEVWPEHADSISELIRAIITDWRHTRDAGGKSNKILQAVQKYSESNDRRYGQISEALWQIIRTLEESTNVHRQPNNEARSTGDHSIAE